MSQLSSWITSAREQLLELATRHSAAGLEPDSAYRVLVLGARLGQARAAGWEVDLPSGLEPLMQQAHATAVSPAPGLLLARLDEQLTGDDDPFGELMDVLLDIDNAATVDDAHGRTEAARELANMADSRASLFSVRIGPLGELATQRLETLPEQASIRGLWETVAHAAAQAVIEALPPVTRALDSLPRQRLLARLRKERIEEDVSSASVLAPLYAVAAADAREAGAGTFTQGAVELFTDGDELRVLVELPQRKRALGEVEVRASVGERSITWRARIVSSSKRAVIARLGTIEEVRERLRQAGLFAASQGLRLVVALTLEEARDEGA